MRIFWVLLCTLAVSAVSLAEEYPENYQEDGYVYRQGYFYRDGYPHTRVKIYDAPVYECGKYIRYYSYRYTRVVNYQAPLPTYTDPDWRSKLLDVAKQRDKFELEARKGAVEQAAYLQAIEVLGLRGNFRIEGYGQPVAYPGYGYHAANYGNYGVNGQTLYGYTYNTIKEAYGSTDMNVLYQQAARLTQGAQALSGQATSEFSGLVGAAGENQARVAEILAKGAAAAKALDSASAAPSSRTQTSSSFVTGGVGVLGGNAAPPRLDGHADPQAVGEFLKTVGLPACGKCHTGADAKGKFNILSYPQMTAEDKAVVLERLFTRDQDKRMPRTDAGGPGELTPAQRKAFVEN